MKMSSLNKIDAANTVEDHHALEAYFNSKAAGATKQVRLHEDMGTTLSVLILLKSKALIVHVGDSRIYRLRRDFFEQLTEDHTFAQAFLQKGFMTSEEASRHPTRHVMTQAVGRGIESIFHKTENVEQSDIFLLCSDGLYDMLPDIEIKDIP